MAEKLVFELTAVDRATAPLRQVTQQINRTTGAIRAQSSAYNASAVSTNKWAKGALQQAGYQVGDFFVQVTNGTSAMQAFGQQGAQMLGIFGPIGAVLGAVVAIGASIGVMFERTAGKAKNFSDAMNQVSTSSEMAASALEAATLPMDEMIKKYGEGASRAKEFAIMQAEAALALTRSLAVTSVDALSGYARSFAILGKTGRNLKPTMDRLMQTFKVGKSEAYLLGEAFTSLYRAGDAQGQIDAITRIRTLMASTNAELSDFPELATAMRDVAILGQETLALEELMRRLSDVVSGSVGPSFSEATTTATSGIDDLIDKLKPLAQTGVDIGRAIQSSMSSALLSMVDGTKSVKDAFKDMAKTIIMKLYEVLVVQRIVNAAMGFLTGKFPGLGNASLPIAGARAMGGQVTAGRPYLVGERGPEIVVPSRNASVTPNNQIGGGGVVVNQTINVSTGVQQTVRAEIKTLLPQIAEASKNAVLDARLRGGSYGRAFA